MRKKAEKRHYSRNRKDRIDARCPMCQKTFEIILFWSGASQPKIYCPPCLLSLEMKSYGSSLDNIYEDTDFDLDYIDGLYFRF